MNRKWTSTFNLFYFCKLVYVYSPTQTKYRETIPAGNSLALWEVHLFLLLPEKQHISVVSLTDDDYSLGDLNM